MDVGPFTAATEIRPSQPEISVSVSSCVAATDTMPPRPASATIAFDRNATTRAPSTTLSAPDTTAAAISPWE